MSHEDDQEVSHAALEEEAAILVCTLDESGRMERAAEFRQLLERGLVSRELLPGGLRLRLRAAEGVEAELRDLIGREKRCCSFFEFAVSRKGGEIELEVRAPESARPFLEALFAGPDEAEEVRRQAGDWPPVAAEEGPERERVKQLCRPYGSRASR